ncbi:23S rRNA (uracil(747)-C(5))-methyltransferase RlmC [Homoserinimonas hongtaonis]|uniref:23S rRNA (uracil(747)-C(5))-methyltransferase RlmC n=1 Tax=Homoserinimonas hongtaonis TaxID=2079791 RepID=UPI000D3B1D15|nr:23S rRNA (uracil(747)-C(5))-methyltransferase RlmC [Salinibacterium hongtaonis]AWB90363.1 23S rRNA (uracil(747)-C(5))-methyltransferase RlmC [Salinibacterium hongtaonis]
MQCSYFDAGLCLSCTLLPQPYAEQLADKHAHCQRMLADYPGIQWMPPVASAESGFRNKAKMVVGGTVDAPTLGLLDGQMRGIDLQGCGILQPGLTAAFPAIADFITLAGLVPYDVAARRGELKNVLLTESADGDLMLRFVLRSSESLPRIRKHLPWLEHRVPSLRVISANLLPEHRAAIEGLDEILLTAQSTLPMRVGDVELALRPQSFFQTNTAIASALYRQAHEWVDSVNPASVWDLYCGVGGFALHCAAPGRTVTGIEVSAEAIESARAASVGLPGMAFETADATAFALASTEAPDLVIVNPPRRGIGPDLSGWLEASSVQTVVYSSCNSVTLARDLAAMPSLVPTRARVLDMFPHTNHYEAIVLLQRVPSRG